MTDLIQTLTAAMQESKAWPAVYGAGTAEVLARAALTAINEAGLAIVPREPTEAMLGAGADFSIAAHPLNACRNALEIYIAMITATTTGEQHG